MLQELPSVVQYNIHVSHQIAVCIQHSGSHHALTVVVVEEEGWASTRGHGAKVTTNALDLISCGDCPLQSRGANQVILNEGNK